MTTAAMGKLLESYLTDLEERKVSGAATAATSRVRLQ
jgi:hypothetical protein